jgi:hypothetical protein
MTSFKTDFWGLMAILMLVGLLTGGTFAIAAAFAMAWKYALAWGAATAAMSIFYLFAEQARKKSAAKDIEKMFSCKPEHFIDLQQQANGKWAFGR